MDWGFIKDNGYAAWQVIPVFFATYIGMLLVFGGSSELTWRAYHIPSANETEPESEAGMVVSIVIGSCLLSLAIVYAIAACLIIPMIMTRRQQRARQAHSLIPEPDDVSVEKESTNWFLSSETDVEAVQELEVAASHTDRYR